MKRKDFLYSISALFGLGVNIDFSGVSKPEMLYFKDDGVTPNSHLPLLRYKGAFSERGLDGASWLEQKFYSNNWSNSWRNGIFDFQHYHSIAHEVLGIYSGEANVLLGGENGEIVKVTAGDIIVIPAGVGHKNLGSENLGVVGAYPGGMQVDIVRSTPDQRPRVDQNIAKVPLPKQDPFHGEQDGLLNIWK